MRSSGEEVNFSLHSHMIQLRERRVGGGEGWHNGAGRDECLKTSTSVEREGPVGSIRYTTLCRLITSESPVLCAQACDATAKKKNMIS